MTPQPQVKHTGRTRPQPRFRVCREHLIPKLGSLTPVCTGTPSHGCRCYPHASETSPILFHWVAQIANFPGLLQLTQLVKVPPSKKANLNRALKVESKVRQFPQRGISKTPCTDVRETQEGIRNTRAAGRAELVATVVTKESNIQNHQGAHNTQHHSHALSLLCVLTHAKLHILIFNSCTQTIPDHPFAPVPNLRVSKPSLNWSQSSRASSFKHNTSNCLTSNIAQNNG